MRNISQQTFSKFSENYESWKFDKSQQSIGALNFKIHKFQSRIFMYHEIY